jgi:hypothetical protein
LCRECQRLGAEELQYRQALRDLERLVSWDGIIRRKRRQQFAPFLEHANPRVRALAEELQQEDLRVRELYKRAREEDERLLESQVLREYALAEEEDFAPEDFASEDDQVPF